MRLERVITHKTTSRFIASCGIYIGRDKCRNKLQNVYKIHVCRLRITISAKTRYK